jgi:hypothetical protein
MPARRNRELWLAFLAILAISIFYGFVVVMLGGISPAREFFGHSLGVVGFTLMIMTETLYSFRKRSRRASWGRMSSWLDFHIFTGLVGPYLVLLHSSWKFNGLAGVAMLLTVIIVASGILGRYIYTAVPRTAEGVEVESAQLERQIAQVDAELQSMLAQAQPETRALLQRKSLAPVVSDQVSGAAVSAAAAGAAVIPAPATASSATGLGLIFGRSLDEFRFRWDWWRARRRMSGETRSRLLQLESLIQRRRTLYRQVSSLAAARRLLAVWHAVHIPIGMVLFTAAFIHTLAAFYYATLLR